MRVALIGHACWPNAGSEPGITWNWATSLARHHDVTLFAHPSERGLVEEELAQRPIDRLKFEWVTLPPTIDPWKPKRGERGIRLHYRLWQHVVLRRLREAHAREKFDLVHHVSWGALHQPPLVWKIGLPFVWGPVGGGQTWPAAFQSYATQGGMEERIRRLMVRMVPWNPSVVRAARAASLTLATNPETAALIHRLGARRVEIFPDYGVKEEWMAVSPRPPKANGSMQMLWAGRCEPRKGVPLLLEAMASVPQVELVAAGDGPCRTAWQNQAQRLGIEKRVHFIGQVPWTKMADLFQASDVFAFPSLRDSFGTVILEAMARRLPLIALDHQGVGYIAPPEAAMKVAVTEPIETVAGLARAMSVLAASPELRKKMGEAALACVARQTWDKRAEQMCRWYEESVRAYRDL